MQIKDHVYMPVYTDVGNECPYLCRCLCPYTCLIHLTVYMFVHMPLNMPYTLIHTHICTQVQPIAIHMSGTQVQPIAIHRHICTQVQPIASSVQLQTDDSSTRVAPVAKRSSTAAATISVGEEAIPRESTPMRMSVHMSIHMCGSES